MWKIAFLWKLMEDHRELLMTSACLAPTLMIYDVYMSEIILFNLHTLQLDIASSMCTFFQNRKGHKELSDRYCITFIYLNYINCFIHTGQHWLLSQSVLWPLHMCSPCGYIYLSLQSYSETHLWSSTCELMKPHFSRVRMRLCNLISNINLHLVGTCTQDLVGGQTC